MHKNNSSVMKRWIAGLSATFVMALSGLVPEPSYADRARAFFYCGKDALGNPVTIADNGYRKIALIRWIDSAFSSSAYSRENLCVQVSKNFQQNFEANNLNYLVPARANELPVICASSTPVSRIIECPSSRILMVLRPMDDPNQFIKKLYELNTGKSSKAINHSSAIIQINQTYNLDNNLWLIASASVIPPIQNIPSTRKNPWGKSSENLPPSNRSSEGKLPLTEQDKQVTFACVATDKTIATVARTSNQDIPIITWSSKIFSSDWTPEKRCQQVTKKFENLRQKNALNYITTSVVNGSPVICAVKTVNESCTDEAILITLKDRSEAQKVFDQMFLSNSDIPVDDNGFGKRDGRDSVCMSRSASGNCSGLLISAIEL